MIRLPRSLQGRLLVLVLSVVVVVWLATAVLTWFDARNELDELLDGHLAQAAALLVVQQAQEIEDNGHGIDAPTLHRYAPKVAFQVFHEGRLALRSANAPIAPMVDAGMQLRTGFRTVQLDGMAWRVFATRGAERDVQVYVGEQLSSRDAILWAVLRSTLGPWPWHCRRWRWRCGGRCAGVSLPCAASGARWRSASHTPCIRSGLMAPPPRCGPWSRR